MKKTMIFAALVLAVSAGAAFAHCGKCPGDKKAGDAKAAEAKPGKKDCGDCPSKKKCSGKMCPETIPGVETSARNIKDGVEITMTAKSQETIAQAQELAVVHYSAKETMDKNCPGRVPGAEIKIENLPNGVKVFMTGKTPETVKKIQAASAREHAHAASVKTAGKKEAKAGKKYMCAMKCVEAAAPGKCPKCGMPMEEIK
jgi:rubrerythrin